MTAPQRTPVRRPTRPVSPSPECVETTYRKLLGRRAWRRLHPEIRRRFVVRPAPGAAIRFRGLMSTVEASLAGVLFAHACRLLGRPLTTRRGTNVPVDIRLTWDGRRRGVRWLRRYHFGGAAPMAVSTTKARDGDELVEHVGRGFSMTMALAERGGDLVFVSTGYRLRVGRLRVRIPDWLTPGVTTVTHEHLAPGRFRFTLAVEHPVLGRTFHQDGEFEDARQNG